MPIPTDTGQCPVTPAEVAALRKVETFAETLKQSGDLDRLRAALRDAGNVSLRIRPAESAQPPGGLAGLRRRQSARAQTIERANESALLAADLAAHGNCGSAAINLRAAREEAASAGGRKPTVRTLRRTMKLARTAIKACRVVRAEQGSK